MSKKLLLPAALAVAAALTSWFVDAATPDADTASVASTKPAYGTDLQAAKSVNGDSPGTVYFSKSFSEPSPSARARPAPSERDFKSGVGPAQMFQLRDAAGG
jgi:hypothetical protein